MTQRVEDVAAFVELFASWNARINLSAARSRADIEEHVADCQALVPLLDGVSSVVDVGAGGGFPSVIIAIAKPETRVLALEPIHKKHAFLRTCARELGLANLEVEARRVEQQAEVGFDVATSRATFDLATWMEIGGRLVREGGRVIGFEGAEQLQLPAGWGRHRYGLGSKQRAFIIRMT